MKNIHVHFRASSIPACIFTALLLTACSTTPKGEYTSVVATEEGVPGGTLLETVTTTATVTALDPAKRTYTLRRKDGKESTFVAPPEMVNYPQLRVGDKVTATRSEQFAISLRQPGAPINPTESKVVSLAPKGSKPGMFAVQTSEFTATVWTVNIAKHEVKLRLGDGTVKTFKVRPGVNLNKVVPGDVVVASMTESVTIKVEGQ